MERVILALAKRGPGLLALGVVVGLLWPWLAELARPAMPVAVFLLVLGTLLRVDTLQIKAALRRPSNSIVLPLIIMVGCPLVVGAVARLVGLPANISVALVLAVSAPPSSGNAAVARMLGLDPALALVGTFVSMAIAPITIPALTSLFGGVSIDPLALMWRLAVLIGSAEGVALLLRRRASAMVVRHHGIVDALVLAGLLVFAIGTMAGIQARLLDAPVVVLGFVAIAFALNLALQALGALLPGSLCRRATSGLVLGNRNVGLIWAVLRTGTTPTMALYFAAAQLPIYTLPRLVQAALDGVRRRYPQSSDT
jgi:BASS family bile acid:Na+ symporter